MPLRALLLDFGNVLGFFDHRRACAALAALTSGRWDAEAVYAELFDTGLEALYDRGKLDTTTFLLEVRTRLKLDASDEMLARAWSDIFWPNHEVITQLPSLRQQVRLVLASNTNELHARQFRAQFGDALAHFTAQVLSHEIGARKPERAFFQRCLEVADCPADMCLFVDDKPEFVLAVERCGLRGLVYRPGVDLLMTSERMR